MEHLFYLFKRLQQYTGKILYFNLLGMVVVSFLQGMEIFLLIPLLSYSSITGVKTSSSLVSEIMQSLQGLPELLGLPLILGIYTCLVLGQSLLQRSITIRNVKILQGFVLRLRTETYQSVLQAKWNFFVRKRKSDIINLMTTELGRVSVGLNLTLQFLTNSIFSLFQIGVALWLSAKLTVFVMVCGTIYSIMTRHFVKRSKVLGGITSEVAKSYFAGITDQLNGIKEIKSNCIEESQLSWLQTMFRKMQDEQHEYVQLKANWELCSKVSAAMFISFFILLSVKVFHARLEEQLLIVIIFFRLWPRIVGMQNSVGQIASSIPAFKALNDFEQECKAEKELILGDAQDIEKTMHIQTGLECRSVDFRYNRNEEIYALKDISIQIPANRMTAIVGRSGAGKSTLIDILMGLMQPERGQVLIDGTPLTNDNLLAFRRSISYVPQDPFLFNASIRDNLLMIKADAAEEEIWGALEFSASAEFIKRLPQGLDTLLGDRGIRLSGGERQRLVLARAILRKPSILVLDEATSALDTENETKIQEALERIKGKITVIVIAHRLSTIRNADRVIVLEQGRVVQNGGFVQLAQEKKGLFSNLLENQMGVIK